MVAGIWDRRTRERQSLYLYFMIAVGDVTPITRRKENAWSLHDAFSSHGNPFPLRFLTQQPFWAG